MVKRTITPPTHTHIVKGSARVIYLGPPNYPTWVRPKAGEKPLLGEKKPPEFWQWDRALPFLVSKQVGIAKIYSGDAWGCPLPCCSSFGTMIDIDYSHGGPGYNNLGPE